MAPCLSKFPSLCLEAIFSHVPLVDLLRSVGLVCTSWHSSRRTELMRRRRLVIVQREKQLENLNYNRLYCPFGTELIQHVRRDDGSPWLTVESLDHIKFNAVVAPDFQFTISSLLDLSNITQLDLLFNSVPNSTLTQAIRLIEHLTEHLIELKFAIRISYNGTNDEKLALSHNVTNLFGCLDRLHSLRHLKLSLNFPHLNLRPDLSFLSRLTTLSIFVWGIVEAPFIRPNSEVDWLTSSLNEYATNIDSIDFYTYVNLAQQGGQLNTKFNVLCLNGPRFEEYDDMRLFCSRFSSLAKLEILDLSMPMTMLARCLSQLPKLVHLALQFFDFPQVEAQTEEGEPPQRDIAQVPSVRLLTLQFFIKSHLDTERLFVSEIFPNLQVLCLRYNFLPCTVCEITTLQYGQSQNIENADTELAQRLTECSRLMRQPFQRCQKLHTISLVSRDKETFVSVDEH